MLSGVFSEETVNQTGNSTLGNATTLRKTSTTTAPPIELGRCYLPTDCEDIDFEWDNQNEDSNITCCNANGTELNVTDYLGFCCADGVILKPSTNNKCIAIILLVISIVCCGIAIIFVALKLSTKYEPSKDYKSGGGPFSNLSFPTEKTAPKNSVTLPVERPYISCPLFDESANESSEEEKMTSSLLSKKPNQQRLEFEFAEDDTVESKLFKSVTDQIIKDKGDVPKMPTRADIFQDHFDIGTGTGNAIPNDDAKIADYMGPKMDV